MSDLQNLANIFNTKPVVAGLFILIFFIWSLYWKGRSLWLSAHKGDKVWFVVLLILNTAGIVDMIYIYLLAKPGDPEYTAKEKEE